MVHSIDGAAPLAYGPLSDLDGVLVLAVLLISQVDTSGAQWVSVVEGGWSVDTVLLYLGAAASISLAVESLELGLVLKEAVLTVLLDHSTVVQHGDAAYATLALRLGVPVSILDLLVSLLHVAGANWLGLVVQRTTQDVLDVLHIHALRPGVLPLG